ncbi:MAG: SAM-dependent chlorinase/fluorinase [Acidobacteriota bacterium]|nr:SAM-dependent chlorinase/fluorinase [Acidobacteriota bacterium]
MANRLITFTTDFGLSDHFVGTMKGVVAGIAPQARVIDISHDIAPYNVTEAAFVIAEAWAYFPRGTIHVVVVDPGVGSSRRPILAEAGGHYFIAPDNGVLSLVFDAAPHKVRVISNPKFMRREISRTFHGRDIFAPAAAHLAKGAKPAAFGKLIHDYVRLSSAQPALKGKDSWRGAILKVDRFGNLITNFAARDFAAITARPFEMRAGVKRIHRLALTYAEAEVGDLFVIVGSAGYLEIAANQASAASLLGCRAGASVELDLY